MQIRRLIPADGPGYRALRLRALREFPEAFTSSHEEASRKPVAWYAERLGDPDHCFWGACANGALGGMVGLERKPRERERHKATVVGMYVAREHAGAGVGRALAGALLAEARRLGLESLLLTVTEGNTQARRLYLGLGFRSFGIEPHAIRLDGRPLNKDHMVLLLNP